MHLKSCALTETLESFVHHNLLLLAIMIAIILAIELPFTPAAATHFDINTIFVGLIFISQGMKIDFSQVGKLTQYIKLLLGGAVVAIVVYPLMAFAMATIFNLTADHKVGFMLMCSFPNSLEAAMAMAASAGGDPLTAILLLTGLNVFGLISIPLNLGLWLGADSPVSEFEILQKLVFYLFIPVVIGQIIRRLSPCSVSKLTNVNRYLPMLCITALVYLSCSKESTLLRSITLYDIISIVTPSVLLHCMMLGLAFVVARKWLALDKLQQRSFILITSEKPMSLSVALWSLSYADHYPLAIFPILVFYIGQIVVDSFLVSEMLKRDLNRCVRTA